MCPAHPSALRTRRGCGNAPPFVLLVAPFQRLPVQVRHVPKGTPDEEISLHEADETLNLPLGKRMTGLAQLGLKAHVQHEGFVIHLPNWLSVQIPADDHALHVVRQDILGNTHILEGVNHADKQVFLLGIGKEFDVPHTAMVADHDKAGCRKFVAEVILHFHEAPVHLKGFSGRRRVPSATVALRSHKLALGGDKVAVLADIGFHNGQAPAVANLLQPLQAERGVRNVTAQHIVQSTGIAGENRVLSALVLAAVRLENEPVLL